MSLPNHPAILDLREEFNRWAQSGRGEEMEESHLPIVLPMLELMGLKSTDRVLDVGCGSGWLVRRLAAVLPSGSAMGIDVANEMVRRAQLAAASVPNASFFQGTAEDIPAPPEFFSKVISVESAYYWHNVQRGLREIHRVLAPGGSAWILINYYRDNLDCHQWARTLRFLQVCFPPRNGRSDFRPRAFVMFRIAASRTSRPLPKSMRADGSAMPLRCSASRPKVRCS